MLENIFIPMLDLQLFAEGTGGSAGGTGAGDGGTGAVGATGETATAAVSQTKGANKSNPLADVKYGKQVVEVAESPAAEVKETPTEDLNAKYDRLIKGELKEIHDARMQDMIQRRLKNTKETVEKYEALSPTLEILAKKYGVDASDIESLNKAIAEDDTYFEEEALEKGITVEQLKEIRKMERENAELKRQMDERERRDKAAKDYSMWMSQAESTKQVYPSFDLRTEMQNPRVLDLLKSNIDVRTAYEVLHKDEIIPAAMQFTAKKVEEKLTNKIIANGARPSENGTSSQSGAVVKSDVSQLSKADRQEIIRRIANGERISFS